MPVARLVTAGGGQLSSVIKSAYSGPTFYLRCLAKLQSLKTYLVFTKSGLINLE